MTDGVPAATDPLAPPETVSVGQYLGIRLRQLGLAHLFGVPGDFNLTLLDHLLSVEGLGWVGSTNELNAAYAADAHARVRRGPAALVTTYGVGELSAVNGVAGAFAEDVPVVHISGGPTTAAQNAGALLHHSLLDGDHGRFARMIDEVVVASAVLRPSSAPAEIDRVLRAALSASKPVSISIPADVAVAPVPSGGLRVLLTPRVTDPIALAGFRAALAQRMDGAQSLTVLAGPRLHRRNVEPLVQELAEVPGVRVASQAGSKGILDESHPASLGTYVGRLTESSTTRDAVDDAELLVLAGTVLSDLLTGGFSHRFDPARAVELGLHEARVGDARFPEISLGDALKAVRDAAARLRLAPVPARAARQPVVAGVASGPLRQASFWTAVQQWLAPDTLLIADAGTSFYGVLGLQLPDRTDLIGQPVWSSIGYSLPALLGAGLADARRCVCITGDGAAQLTVQELAVALRRVRAPIIILLDNGGYTVERAIQSPQAVYQDVTRWDWTLLPAFLAPEVPVETLTARTVEDFGAALRLASDSPDRAVLIRAVLPQDDVPPLLARLTEELRRANQAAA